MPLSRAVLAAILCLSASVAASADGEVVSTMRNVNAVVEAHGFRINPAYDMAAEAGVNDLAPVQAFEIARPDGRAVTLGRLYTSCSCIQLEAPKRTFEPGERIVLQLRNITPTPLNGQVYAFYVQITSPIRATLRYDTFVQSKNPAFTEIAASSESPAPESSGSDAAPASPIELIVPSAGGAAAETVAEVKEAAADVADAVRAEVADARSAVDAAREEMDAYFEDQSASAASLPEPELPEPLPPPAEVVQAAGEAGETRADAAGGLSVRPPAGMTSQTAPAVPEEPAPEPEPAAPVVAAPAAPVAPAATAAPVPPPPAASAAAPAPQAMTGQKPLETISLITIGVRDMARSVRFYEELGWRRASRNKYDQTAFFQLNGQVLALYPLSEQLKEQNMDGATPAPGGITLALHVADKGDVRPIYDSFIAAGGVSLREPTEMPSGAVTSYVADPDGNPWEISWVPQFRVDSEGGLWLP